MIVSWLTTNQCNLDCAHCYQDAGDKASKELTTQEAKNLIDGIQRAGFKIMIFSGGEPLMREDIFELVAYASSKGLRPVFGTNGMLITKEVAQKLKDAGAMGMGISVDSMCAEKHNKFRGKEDAYQLTMEGIKNCSEVGLPFQVHTTVVDWNESEVFEITDYAIELGAVAHYIFFLIPVGRAVEMKDESLEVNAYENLLRKIMEKQKQIDIDIKPTCAPQFVRLAKEMGVESRFTRGCLAGISYCIVDPTGEVRPCAYMVEEVGNVRETPFEEIWNNSEFFAKLRTQEYSGFCKDCDYRETCGGCRARAGYYNNGDYMAEDSYCAYGIELAKKEKGE